MKAITLSLLALATVATAQSPLTTTFANNNGGAAGGAVYFDLECLDPAGISINSLDLNFQGAGGIAGTVDIYIKPDTWDPVTGVWFGPVSVGTVASTSAEGTPTPVTLSAPIELGVGCKIGVAIVNDGNLAHAYTTATTLPPTTATAELELTVGGGSNVAFSEPVFQPRLVNANVYYTSGGTCPTFPVLATVTPQGSGCGPAVPDAGSIYEQQAAGTNDLDGWKLVATRNGGAYDYSLEAGLGFTAPGTALALGDDDSVDSASVGGTLGLWVGSNGWVGFGPGNSNAFAPVVATMLGNAGGGIYSWTDMQPDAAGSGLVYYDEAGGVATVTYDGCYGWGTTDPNFIQIIFDSNTGDFSIEWAGLGAGNPEDLLIGYTPAGASVDPGPNDLSADLPLSRTAVDIGDLSLTAIGTPIQGATAANFDVVTGGIPPSALSHFGILGLARPGLPLDGFGLPGCFLNADLISTQFAFPITTPEYTWTGLTIPANTVLPVLGFEFNLQGVIFGTSVNTFLGLGAQTSNGLKCVVGEL